MKPTHVLGGARTWGGWVRRRGEGGEGRVWAGGRGGLGSGLFGFVHFVRRGRLAPAPGPGSAAPPWTPRIGISGRSSTRSRARKRSGGSKCGTPRELNCPARCGPKTSTRATSSIELHVTTTLLDRASLARSTGSGRPLPPTRRRRPGGSIQAKPDAGGPGGRRTPWPGCRGQAAPANKMHEPKKPRPQPTPPAGPDPPLPSPLRPFSAPLPLPPPQSLSEPPSRMPTTTQL